MAFSTKSRQVADLNSNSISYTADGGVATTVESKLRESVSVKDFGATGDGVTDDTSAIQAAIDAVIVNGGDIIFPEGAYGIYGSGGDSLLNGLLLGWQGVYTEEPKIRLVGDGSAQLNCYTANTIMIRASRPSVEIHNLTINGRGLSQVWGVGLVAESRETIPATEVSQSYFKMFDCQVLNCTEGLVAEPAVTVSGADSGCFYPVISHSTFNLNTRAIWFKGCNATAMSLQSGSDLAQSQNNRVTRANILACRIERGNTGVDLEFATETTILGCNFQNMLAGTFGTSPHTNATGLYLGEPTENTNVFGGVAENCDYSIDNSATEQNNVIYGFPLSGLGNNLGLLTRHNNDRVLIANVNSASPAPLRIDYGNSSFASLVADKGGVGTKDMTLYTNGAERMSWFNGTTTHHGSLGNITFNSAGNEVATTATSMTLKSGGFTRVQSSGVQAVLLNVNGTDIVAVDGSSIYPNTDNVYSCGLAARRWSVIYSATGTINTSDAREKTFLTIEEAEKAAALEIKANLRKFKFNNAVESKGDDARIHFGASAQQVSEILTKYGLVPEQYAFYCYDEWEAETDEYGNVVTEAGNRYGIRYEELLSFIIAAL